ncbi:DUF1573 domain-containing protein [bacterium]|nr:DUF1573 domain-containing protein [Candidatus Elulimicrobium humile]
MPARGSQITRQDYNDIRKIVFNVLGAGGTNPTTNLSDPTFGYGQSLQSSDIPLGPNQTITELQWDRLRADIGKAYTHQVGSIPSLFDVSTSTIISFSQVYETYLAAANDILANRNLFAGSQKPQNPVIVANGTKTLTTAWSDSVKQIVSVTFNSAAEARYFFNSGATINFRSSRAGGTTTPQNAAAQNNSWTSFLNNTVGTLSFGKTQFYSLTSGGLAPGATPIFFFTASAPYSNNYYRIKANCNVPNNANGTATFISFEIEWIDSTILPSIATDLIDGTLTSVISETKSTGNLTIQSPINYSIGELSASGTPVNLSPQFTLTSNVDTVNEGSNVIFTFTSRNYPAGKSYQLEILGISDSDLQGSTGGTKTITATGNDTLATATYTVTIKADQISDPGESITARITIPADGFQNGEVLNKTVTIVDSSLTPTPKMTLTATTATVIAGEPEWGTYAQVTAANVGTGVLNITGVSINKGASLSDHQTDFPGNPTSINQIWYEGNFGVGATGSFNIRFKSSIVGTHTAVITVTSNGNDTAGGGPAPGSTKTVNVTVNVIAATYGLVTSPLLAYTASYATDGITPGETPLQTISLTNQTGNATIQLGTPAVTISNQGNLVPTIVGNPNGQNIAPGGSTSFQVKFTGLQAPQTQAVSINIDAGAAGTKTITGTITGTASQPGIAISTQAITATPVQINVEDTKTFTITNTGSAELNITNIAASGQNSYSTITITPTTLTLAKGAPAQTITVKMKRSRIGSDTATITITSNAPAPNNTRTLSVNLTSTALTPIYYAQITNSNTVTSTSATVSGRRGAQNITVFFTFAEPNADYYGYHEQASGVITGLPAGTTPGQAQQQGLRKRTSDNVGRVDFWPSANFELEGWDVGLSKLYAWVPVGKRDNGTQVWMDLPGSSGGLGGGTLQFEIFPNPTISVTPNTLTYGILEYNPALAGQPTPTFPKTKFSLKNGYQNQPLYIFLRWFGTALTGTGGSQGATLDSTGTISVDYTIGWTEIPNTGLNLPLYPGVYTYSLRQVYKGVDYLSNEVTITVNQSPGYFQLTLPAGYGVSNGYPVGSVGNLLVTQDACWTNNSQLTDAGRWYRFFRTITISPGSYQIRAWADDTVWFGVVNSALGTLVPGQSSNLPTGPTVANFTVPAGTNRITITWVAFNDGQFGGTWQTNPGWFAVQIWQGSTKIWGCSNSTSALY